MEKLQLQNSPIVSYDPRWFVWTIMFLLVTGVGLVSYIIVTTEDAIDSHVITRHRDNKNVVQGEPVVPE